MSSSVRKDEGERSESSPFQKSHSGVLYGGDSMAFNSVSSPTKHHPFKAGSKNRAVAVSSRGKLPPLGQLRDGERVQTYEQVGSSFLRNMGSNSQPNKYGSPVKDVSSHRDTDQQWEQLTRGGGRRIQSEGDVIRNNKKIANDIRSKIKVFDPDKLLHNHQRELYSMRALAASDSRVNTGAGVRIVMPKKRNSLTNSKDVSSQNPAPPPSQYRHLPPLQQEFRKSEDKYNQYESQGVRNDVYPNDILSLSSSPKSSISSRLDRERKSVTFSEADHNELQSSFNPSFSSSSSSSRPYQEKKNFAEPITTNSHQADVRKADTILDTSSVRSGGSGVNVSDYLAGLYDRTNDDSGSDSDDNDGEEEGIGWSPFVIPVGN